METSERTLEGLRIFVAEDEFLILLDIENMLKELGCTIVGSAATVEVALKAIGQHAIDGALLDMNLHGRRITPVAEELAARGTPFVLCSGYGKEPRDEAVFKAAPRLTKPFNLKSLRSIMEQSFLDVVKK